LDKLNNMDVNKILYYHQIIYFLYGDIRNLLNDEHGLAYRHGLCDQGEQGSW
jgi:uncharacterized phage-associated protein